VTGRDTGRSAAVLVATMFGAGRAPAIPGTFGTLASVPPAVLLARWLPPWGFAIATGVLTGVGVWTSGIAARVMERKDPRPVVIDEAAGFFVTLLYLPVRGPEGLVTVLLGFILFRLMDVLKPPPARGAEGLPGGWGIVVDDLIAGAYANLALRILLRLFGTLSLGWATA
jgi:phosphatidylglycerophosphatase A